MPYTLKFQFLQDLEGELEQMKLEEATLIRRLAANMKNGSTNQTLANGHGNHNSGGSDLQTKLEEVQRTRKELGKFSETTLL